MAYTDSYAIETQTTGSNQGTWGTKTDTNWDRMEAIVGRSEIITLSGTTYALNTNDGVTVGDANYTGGNRVLKFIGNPTGHCTVTINPAGGRKTYFIINATTGGTYNLIISQGGATTVTIASGYAELVYTNPDNDGSANHVYGFFDNTIKLNGKVLTAAQTNITSVGTLTALSVAGTVVPLLVRYSATSNGIQTDLAAGTNVAQSAADGTTFNCLTSHASATSDVVKMSSNTASGTAFNFLKCIGDADGGSPDNEFILRGDGTGFADTAWDASGAADYADYFEWLDGNENADDRVGRTVVLSGDKIRVATESDDPSSIVGVISGRPAFVGNSGQLSWNQRYLKDDFDRYWLTEVEVVSWETENEEGGYETTISYRVDDVPEGTVVPPDATYSMSETKIPNPDYDESLVYVPRSERPEWDPVGLTGRLRIIKGCPVNPSWKLLKNISSIVDEWLVR